MTARAKAGLSPSQEDYLEAILFTCREKPAARASDLARRLKVTRASVTGALRVLGQKGLVQYTRYEMISLTLTGRTVAEAVARRHETLARFLALVLHVPQVEAEDAACRMEHGMTASVLDRFNAFLRFAETCPQAGAQLWDACSLLASQPSSADCPVCLEQAPRRLRSLRRVQEQ